MKKIKLEVVVEYKDAIEILRFFQGLDIDGSTLYGIRMEECDA